MVVKPKKITKFWPIHKILEDFPDTVEIMMETGLQCFGCSANTEELLHQGMEGHGFTPEQIDEFVANVNKFIEDNANEKLRDPSPDDFDIQMAKIEVGSGYKLAGLVITDSAYKAIHDWKTAAALRIQVNAGGCNGFSYEYTYVNERNKGDYTFTLSDKLDIFLDAFSFDKLYGSTMDYESGLKGNGLIFRNPNVTSECHCGASVGF